MQYPRANNESEVQNPPWTISKCEQATDRILEDPVVTRLRSALAEASSPSLYLVGGALRDAWLGRETRDFDFVVPGEARTVAKRIAAALDARLRPAG